MVGFVQPAQQIPQNLLARQSPVNEERRHIHAMNHISHVGQEEVEIVAAIIAQKRNI
jgi:hypothetical protein